MEELQGIPPGSDDLPFQLRQRWYQRVGWCILISFLVAAACGMFGSGWYSSSTKGNKTFSVDYERVGRQRAETSLTIRFKGQTAGSPVKLGLNASYLSHVKVEGITPSPSKMEITEDGSVWTFELAPEEEAGQLHLTVKPETPGLAKLELRLGSESLWLNQLILP